jgi:hypothetical protein
LIMIIGISIPRKFVIYLKTKSTSNGPAIMLTDKTANTVVDQNNRSPFRLFTITARISCKTLRPSHNSAQISSFSVLGPASASDPVLNQTPSSEYRKNRTAHPNKRVFTMRRSFGCSTKPIIARPQLGLIDRSKTERVGSNPMQQIRNTKNQTNIHSRALACICYLTWQAVKESNYAADTC